MQRLKSFRFVFFQMRSHHGLYNDIFESSDEEESHSDHNRGKLTLTESSVALVIGVTCVTFMAIFLVDGIHYIVEERHVKDAYV